MREAGAATALAVLLATAWASGAQSAPSTAAAAPAPPGESPSVNAVWVPKDLSLTYMGFTSHYSCDGIRDKVISVLRTVGAQPGFKVTVSGCVHQSGPEIMPRVRVRAALPREATPELLAELAKERAAHDGGQKGDAKPAVGEAVKSFPATWRTVAFRGSELEDVQRGDCELMEQLVREVLVPLGAREGEGSGTNCVPHQITLDAVRVRLQVLQPSQPAKGRAP